MRPTISALAAASIAALTLGIAATPSHAVSCTITSNQTTTYTVTGGITSAGHLLVIAMRAGLETSMVRATTRFLDTFGSLGFVNLAKIEAGQTSSAFQVTGIGGESGTWTVSQAVVNAYDQLAIGLKAGNSWAVVLLVDGLLSGTWATTRDLSHANLYGIPGTPSVVPLPGALLLMGTVLGGGVGFAGWRRRRGKGTASLASA